ncbi:hypothetical protein BGZ81_003805 [Podila clonocystis]|nr:hypothetical protein BGZ81_003805 [Podila clonocystis]
MRVNGAVIRELARKDVPIDKVYPIFIESRGYAANFHTIRKIDTVLAAGKATQKAVQLPTDKFQLKEFIKSDQMHILVRFAVCIDI